MHRYNKKLVVGVVTCWVMLSVCLSAATSGDRTLSNDPLFQPADEDPRLVLEAGGHVAVIRSLLFTADGRELISAGDDKTIRIWSVSPDGMNANLKRTIRGQIGDGRAGQIFAAALSPPDSDGHHQWLAVGGYLAGKTDERNAVRLHGYDDGKVKALLVGHGDNILALSFSPSGRWLASAGKDRTIRLWDLSALQDNYMDKAPLILNGHTDRITELAWSTTGNRLASASYDGTVGLWDTSLLVHESPTLIARLKGHSGKVRTVAFHPREAVLASGGNDQSIRLWQASDGQSMGILATADHSLSALAFSPDGQSVIAGNFSPPRPDHLTLFSYPEGKTQLEFSGHDNLVIATAFHPSGGWLASAGGENKEILLWRAGDGQILSQLEGRGRTINSVAFSGNGRVISWGQTSNFAAINDRGPLEQRFDLLELEQNTGGLPKSESLRAVEKIGSLSLKVEKDGSSLLHVMKGWKRLCTIERNAQEGAWHNAYTLTPDGRFILSGGQNGELRLYDINGQSRARLVGHAGQIKAVAISADGRWALSGANDQTVRLWDLSSLSASGDSEIKFTLSLFPANDGEWIAWTPEGYFTASENGARQIGYSINRGISEIATFVSVDDLYDRFYRPDLVQARLQGDPQELWQRKEAAVTVNDVIAGGLAPLVTIINPTADNSIDSLTVDVDAKAVDQGGGIGKIVWRINGTTVATDSFTGGLDSRMAIADHQPKDNRVVRLNQSLDLLPGDNLIELLAYNQNNEIASSPTFLRLTVKPPPETSPVASPSAPDAVSTTPRPSSETDSVTAPADKPSIPSEPSKTLVSSVSDSANTSVAPVGPMEPRLRVKSAISKQPALHLLVVCVDNYRDRALRLKYAVQDGRAIADIIQQTGKSLFQDVNVTLLFDDRVTIPELNRAFGKIEAAISPQDVFMFYLAGHGVTRDGRYYFLPYDFRFTNDEAIVLRAVNQDHLQKWLSLISARKSLVMIDTCESGSFTQSMVSMRGMAQKTAIAKLTRATGRATIVASSDEQPAYEGYQGHGVFTYVLLEGLRHTDATFGNRDGYTGLFELAAFVNDQVPTITMNAFNFEQIPQVHMVGTDFPIGVAMITDS